jgi:hypothetical protein
MASQIIILTTIWAEFTCHSVYPNVVCVDMGPRKEDNKMKLNVQEM